MCTYDTSCIAAIFFLDFKPHNHRYSLLLTFYASLEMRNSLVRLRFVSIRRFFTYYYVTVVESHLCVFLVSIHGSLRLLHLLRACSAEIQTSERPLVLMDFPKEEQHESSSCRGDFAPLAPSNYQT
jgi:hypothetical protein